MMSNILLLAQTQPTTGPEAVAVDPFVMVVVAACLASAGAIALRKLYRVPAVPELPVPNPPAILLGLLGATIGTFFAVPSLYMAGAHLDVASLATPSGKRLLVILDLCARVIAVAVALTLLMQLGLLQEIFRWTAARARPIRHALGTYLLVIPWVIVVAAITKQIAHAIGADPNATHELFKLWGGDTPGPTLFKIVAVVSAVVVAPISEELVFRGLLQRVFQSLTRRPAVAILLSSVLFALIHQPWPLQPPVFVLSVFLGLAYFRTGNLLVPILVHAVFNAINMALVTLLLN